MKKINLFIIYFFGAFVSLLYATIDFQPFKAYMPRSDASAILADIKYQNNTNISGAQTIFNNIKQIKSYEEIRELSDAAAIKEFISSGFFEREKKPCFYIYSQQRKDIVNTGIIGKISIENYEKGEIKKHENIIESKAEFAQDIITIQNAFIEPILLCYKDNPIINNIIAKKIASYPDFVIDTKHKTKHFIWKIKDEKSINEISKIFSTIPNLYIADGHHRSAAAQRLKNAKKNIAGDKSCNANTNNNQELCEINYMTAAVFPESQITIYPYHRLLKEINNLTKSEFKKLLGQSFTIEKTIKKTVPHKNIRMFYNSQWYTLKLKKQNPDSTWNKFKNLFKKPQNYPIENIIPYIFQKNVIEPIFKNDSNKIGQNIEFVSGNLSIENLLLKYIKGDFVVMFLLPALSFSDLLKVVNSNENLPPKSTWIEPKIKAGIFVKELEE
ncbi:DUF1015 family protein [Candidatus Dependentiae bacterium]|nr:DUF1015 family protein [Candidatus Dependentiae bacterium]MCG2755973.1 DUF1015 family protein [Candidatus Dependentiae bacterium]